MAPKGKKGKKAGDDWDEGLGESADPIAQAEAEAKAADAAAEEEETGGGGLMAALRKNKEKRKKKGKNVGPDDLEGEGDTVTPTVDESLDLAAKAPVEATMDDDDGEEETNVVRTKRFDVRPMSPEDAITQMEALGHDFYVFRNMDSQGVGVVYRRRDGHYGLIEPS